MISEPIDHRREKFIVLVGLTFFWFIAALINLLATQTGLAYSVIFLLSSVGWGVGILFWCKIDAEQRRDELSVPMQIALVGLGIFALIYYLFTTRQGNGRIKAMGWLMLYTLSSYILVVMMVAVSLAILKTAGIEMPQQPTAEAAEQ